MQCTGRAVTRLVDGQHYFKSASKHTYAAQASRAEVVKTIARIKEHAQLTNEKLAQLLQTAITNSPHYVYQYLPLSDAIRQTVQRICHLNLSKEPSSLDNLVIPDHMRRTLNEVDFLIHDSTLEQDGMLIFTILDNIHHLNRSPFWVMDGTFKTVPNMFKQLYSIHGGSENSRIVPLVFSLMTSKSEESYRQLFQELIDFGEVHGIDLSPQVVLTNFEAAVINSIQSEFDNVQYKGCHFHLSQCIYCRVQSLGLTSRYGKDEDFSLLIRYISALAFLPPEEILSAFDELKLHIPPEASRIV
ncbi:12769_t:CDS:2, partial [Dentiscutata heterogama]